MATAVQVEEYTVFAYTHADQHSRDTAEAEAKAVSVAKSMAGVLQVTSGGLTEYSKARDAYCFALTLLMSHPPEIQN